MKEENESFTKARLQSSIDQSYMIKRKKLNDAYNVIKLYTELGDNKISDDLKVKAQSYFYSSNGINYYGKINASEVPDERVITCVNGIKQKSKQIFLDFNRSYKTKIDKNYFEEYINNAFEDLQLAYRLYCLAHDIEINPNISIHEITSLICEISEQKSKE